MAETVGFWQRWECTLRAAWSCILQPRQVNVWIQRSQSACWRPESFVPLVTSAGRQSRTFYPLITLLEGARLELTGAQLTLPQVESASQGLRRERSQSWPCLSRFLVFPSSAFPNGPAYPLRDSIREMDAVETMLFPPFAGTWLWPVLVLLGLSTEPYHKGCASFHPALEKREKSIASWLQNFLLLFLATLSSAAKHLAVFEWKTTKHRKTAEQSWQHTVRCSSGRFVEPLRGIKLEGCWDRRLTQSVVRKLLAIKKEP